MARAVQIPNGRVAAHGDSDGGDALVVGFVDVAVVVDGRPPELADDPDDDGDGVADIEDICALTLVSEPAPDDWMERRYWTDATGSFVDPIGRDSRYTLIDTGGCSASQVIEALELGDGHQRSGLAEGVLVAWGEYMESLQADE